LSCDSLKSGSRGLAPNNASAVRSQIACNDRKKRIQDPSIRKTPIIPPAGLVSRLDRLGNGAFTCDCSVRSLSTTGARISVAGEHNFRGRIYVINIRDGSAYDSQVVWSKGADIGIKFDVVIPLSTTTDVGFSRLKKLWLAKKTS